MRRVGRMRTIAQVALAWAVAFVGVVSGLGPGGRPPVAADCGMQFPATTIGPHRGFAFEGVIRSIDRLPDAFLERITMDVTEMLAGEPVTEVTFDLGRGACSFLQADRYKTGDRLIVTASGPPVDGMDQRYLPEALTWRYEWADRWTFHGIPSPVARRFSAPIRSADTRAEIVALVAPDALPFGVERDAWSVTLERPRSGIRLRDVEPFKGAFVALGSRQAPRGRRQSEPTRPVIVRSTDGIRWSQVADPFPAVRGPEADLSGIIAFRDVLYAVGHERDRLIVWASPDGRRWTRVLAQPMDDDGPSFEGGEVRFLAWLTMAAGDDRLAILGGPAGTPMADEWRAWTTSDGRTWTRSTPTGLQAQTADLVATAAGFAVRTCVCNSEVPRWLIKTSADAVAWEQAGEAPVGVVDLTWDPATERYLAALELSDHFDGQQAAVEASSDGVTWTRLITSPGRTGVPIEVTAGGGAILFLGDGGFGRAGAWAMTSADGGDRWIRTQLPVGRSDACVVSGAVTVSTMVAVGGCRGALAWSGALPESGGAAP